MMEGSEDNRAEKCWAILGPTASGKSELALQMARRHEVEIVSVDSMSVYKGMDVGTAKPDAYARSLARYHLINVIEPEDSFSVRRYREMALEAIAEIKGRHRRPLLVGGSALYFKALLWGLFEGPSADAAVRARLENEAQRRGSVALHRRLGQVDPATAGRIHPNDLKRIVRALEVYELTGSPISAQQTQFHGGPRIPYVAIGLHWPRRQLYERIDQRVDYMMEQGLLHEVKALQDRMGPQAAQALGYAQLLKHLRCELSLREAVECIKRGTRRFAKHQLTWFRKFPGVHWVEPMKFLGGEEFVTTCLGLLVGKS